MEDVATGTSNGGATTHAFGYKVDGPGSFGKDGDGETQPPTDRFINSLSGFQGSIMPEAANNGHPVGVVTDGMIAEPGTGAFLAEVSSRDDTTGISQQVLLGRPNSTDTASHVILGGGEADFVRENTPRCEPDATTLDCRVHEVAEGDGSTTTGRRTDGQNLLRIADAGAAAEPLDGLYGHNSKPFTTAARPVRELPFAVQWTGTADVTGGVLARAEGLNAELLRTEFSRRFDNIDVYRITSRTLFGRNLPYPENQAAPTR